ncbi:MAG TPA: putative manganese-dependent inorganic diphosphatase [Baekduia sp.]|nr:putative manganese-dependent inorganic diphosphatase [Baekduia sp.]
MPIYVTGHRNPDTDSIGSAIAYAELLNSINPDETYLPVRLGELNAQTRWVLERSGAAEPALLRHVMLRVRDVMQETVPLAGQDAPVREVGLMMAREERDLVPLVDDAGTLSGVMTERVLARRYIRESREASRLDAPTATQAIVDVLGGRLVAGEADREVSGRVWVLAMDVASLPAGIVTGDVAVVGNRSDAQRSAIEAGVTLLVLSNDSEPDDDVLALARERGTGVITAPLDSYVTSRMITLSEPSHALMDRHPLTVRPDDLVVDIADDVKDIHYSAAVAVDERRRPVGLVTRADLLNPRPRKVVLVDHAELAQSVPGVEQAAIVEILDHHHIGSIETHIPVRATFDPVGSTATLVVERYLSAGVEPSQSSAIMLVGAVVSDTVILNSPTTTARDRAAIDYLESILGLDAVAFGQEMFGSTSDTSMTPAKDIVSGDAKAYQLATGQSLCIAQVETVGNSLIERSDELLEAMHAARESGGHAVYALMVTDIVAKGTKLLVSGNSAPVARAFESDEQNGMIDLPGVMSRKKQVAPKLLAAF